MFNRPDLHSIFEDLEKPSLSVGAISLFDAVNIFTSSKFFIPDPWTQTKASVGHFYKPLIRKVPRKDVVNTMR